MLIDFYFDLNCIQRAKNQEFMELHDHKAKQLAWRGYGKHLGRTFRKLFHESMWNFESTLLGAIFIEFVILVKTEMLLLTAPGKMS